MLDVRAAIQFVKYKANELNIDPDRVGLIGNSAGAHLAALVALAANEAPFVRQYETDPYANLSTKVKAVVGVYGVYELVEHWNHELIARPGNQTVENLLSAKRDSRRRPKDIFRSVSNQLCSSRKQPDCFFPELGNC